MATVIGSYTYDWGRAIPDHSTQDKTIASTLWTMVHQLLGLLGGLTSGIWTVEGSSDGSTGGMDTVNRWWNGGTFLVTKMPYQSSGGQPLGWMVIKSPSALGPIYLLFARGAGTALGFSGTVDSRIVYVWASRSAFTGGSATTRPTSAGEQALVFNSPYYSTNGYGWRLTWDTSDTGNRNCHLTLASDGAFFWACSLTGGRVTSGFVVNPLQDTRTGDSATVVIAPLQDVANWPANVGLFTGAYLSSSVPSAFCASMLTQDKTVNNYGARFYGWSAGGIGCAFAPIVPVIAGCPASNSLAGDFFGSVGVTNGHFDYERQMYPEFPIYLCLAAGVASQNTIKGKLRDMYWASTGHGTVPEGTVEPNGSDPITRVIWGEVWVPANQVFTP